MGSVMLKKRIIPLLLWQAGRLVKTRGFEAPRVVGDPVKTSRVYSDQDADELCILNISGPREDPNRFFEAVEMIAVETMTPISVGGGIDSLAEAEKAFRFGADKIVVNSACFNTPDIVRQMVRTFGSQAIIASIDYRRTAEGVQLFSRNGKQFEPGSLEDHLLKLKEIGVGEVLLQSIDRDGLGEGYDLDTLAIAVRSIDVPIICAGGAGDYGHLLEAFERQAEAVACGTLFNFGDNNPIRAKAFLRTRGVPLKRSIKGWR